EDHVVALLIRGGTRPHLRSASESGEPRRLHPPECGKLGNTPNVHRAPARAWFAWSKPDLVPFVVDPMADTIDPSDTQSFVDGLWPGKSCATRARLYKPDDKLGGSLCVPVEPIP